MSLYSIHSANSSWPSDDGSLYSDNYSGWTYYAPSSPSAHSLWSCDGTIERLELWTGNEGTSWWSLTDDFPDLVRECTQYTLWEEYDDWRHVSNPTWNWGWGEGPEYIPANMAARGKFLAPRLRIYSPGQTEDFWGHLAATGEDPNDWAGEFLTWCRQKDHSQWCEPRLCRVLEREEKYRAPEDWTKVDWALHKVFNSDF